eukprot:3500725-Rhodomonas_salina.2
MTGGGSAQRRARAAYYASTSHRTAPHAMPVPDIAAWHHVTRPRRKKQSPFCTDRTPTGARATNRRKRAGVLTYSSIRSPCR